MIDKNIPDGFYWIYSNIDPNNKFLVKKYTFVTNKKTGETVTGYGFGIWDGAGFIPLGDVADQVSIIPLQDANSTDRLMYLTDEIRNIIQIQGTNGNWDWDPYMLGLYNGLELAFAMLEDRPPVFKTKPKVWRKKMS